MATYQYRCATHGSLEITRPLGTAPASATCPTCHEPAGRVFSAPMLGRTPGALRSALDRADRSRDQPDVVSAPPPRPASRPHPALANPALRRLPRP